MSVLLEKNSVKRSIFLIVGIGLFYCAIFTYRAVTGGFIIWSYYLQHKAFFLVQDPESIVLFIQSIQFVTYTVFILSVLYLFLKLKRIAYIILLSLTSFSLGTGIVEYFLFPEGHTLWFYCSLFLGVLMTISLLQKHIQDIFLIKEPH